MKVAKLIEILKSCNPEAVVKVTDWGECYRAATEIEEGEIDFNEKLVLFCCLDKDELADETKLLKEIKEGIAPHD